MYEDVCLVCAGLWVGSWRGNSIQSYSTSNGAENWGSVRLEGDDDLTLSTAAQSEGQIRSLGAGIEGRPAPPSPSTSTNKPMKRTSAMILGAGKTFGKKTPQSSLITDTDQTTESSDSFAMTMNDESEQADGQLRTTLALLQTFHAHTSFQLSTLESFLPAPNNRPDSTIYLSPREILAFELGPFSSVDERYLEWLVLEYGGGTSVVVKRGWKDIFGIILGYGY